MYGTCKTQISNNQAQSPQEVPGFTLGKTSPRLMLATASDTTTSNSFPIFCNNARCGGEDGTNDFSTKKLSAKELKDNCTVYNRSYPNKMKLHPSRLSGLKLFAWENMVELKDGELFFNWPWLGKKLNIALAKDTHEPIPKELFSVFDHLLNTHVSKNRYPNIIYLKKLPKYSTISVPITLLVSKNMFGKRKNEQKIVREL